MTDYELYQRIIMCAVAHREQKPCKFLSNLAKVEREAERRLKRLHRKSQTKQ